MTVSCAAFVTVAYYHNAAACWCLVGSILNSFFSRALKFAINESRPADARKADPGMPSSHAQSLYYFATFVAAALLIGDGSGVGATPMARCGAVALQALAAFLTWLRVYAGYHTVAQVAVGAVAGAAAGAGWLVLGRSIALPALRAAGAEGVLYGVTIAASAVFVKKFVSRWRAERKHKES